MSRFILFSIRSKVCESNSIQPRHIWSQLCPVISIPLLVKVINLSLNLMRWQLTSKTTTNQSTTTLLHTTPRVKTHRLHIFLSLFPSDTMELLVQVGWTSSRIKFNFCSYIQHSPYITKIQNTAHPLELTSSFYVDTWRVNDIYIEIWPYFS